MNKTKQWRLSLLKSIQLQLFISFASLPFLIGWGLPISLLSPISTLIFGPFLSCFLLISSLIFFLELLYLPNSLLILLLEKITTFWITCLSLEQRTWLIGFRKPPMVILIFIPIIALAVIHSKKITTITKRICILALLLIVVCTGLKVFSYASTNIIDKIPCNKGEITSINHNKMLILIDPGYIASKPSYESLISYSLIPTILQKTGRLEIDHFIIFKFNKRILDALQFLATKIIIKNIYLPRWNGKIPRFAWQSYIKLKKTIAENNGKIHSISYKKYLHKEEISHLYVAPITTKTVSYYDATYQPLHVEGVINNQIFIL